MTLLIESELNLHGASAQALANNGERHRVEVDLACPFDHWNQVHLATGELPALWTISDGQAAP